MGHESTGEWRARKNKEIQELYRRPSIKEDVIKRRLKWAGPVLAKEHWIVCKNGTGESRKTTTWKIGEDRVRTRTYRENETRNRSEGASNG